MNRIIRLSINIALFGLGLLIVLGSIAFAATDLLLKDVVQVAPARGFLAPQFSPDGERIACAGERFEDIFLVSSDSPPRMLAEGEMAGFGFRWREDGRSIVFRQRVEQRDLACFEVDLNGSTRRLGDSEGRMSEPVIVDGTATVWVHGEDRPRNLDDADGAAPTVMAAGVDGDIVIWTDGEKRVIDGGELTFFSPVISPDGRRVCFMSLEKGLHAADIDGSNLAGLGLGNHPCWAPDSRHVVFCRPLDDGERITSSELYVVDVSDPGKAAPLTASDDMIERYPSVSEDGRWVAFESNGAIYRGRMPAPYVTPGGSRIVR